MAPIGFHYALFSPSCRAVMILAKELDIELDLIIVDVFSGEQKMSEYESINPRKQVPSINDNGFVLGESRAIMMYLINQYSPGHDLYPLDAKKRAEVDRVLFLTAELSERFKAVYDWIQSEKQWVCPREPMNKYFDLLKSLELLVKDRTFLAGDGMTIADISFICDLTIVTDAFDVDVSTVVPNIATWAKRMKTTIHEYELIVEPLAGMKEVLAAHLGVDIE